MKRPVFVFLLLMIFAGCSQQPEKTQNINNHEAFDSLLTDYYENRIRLFPLEATSNGDNRFNDQLPLDIGIAHRTEVQETYSNLLTELNKFNKEDLSDEDQLSYDILKWELEGSLESYKHPFHLIPINQFWSLPLTMATLGSGKGQQPFKTAEDYNNFLKRIDGFVIWCDTAISNMNLGIEQKITVNKTLIERVIPQMRSMVVKNPEESVFYKPVMNFPDSFTDEEKNNLTNAYTDAINNKIIPSYKKLHTYFVDTYLPNCRTSIGTAELPGGNEMYNYLIKKYTTEELTPDSIFNLGMSEVNRIHAEMERVKDETGFEGDLVSFFKFMNTDPKFFPFKTEQEVLDSFNNIHAKMAPQVEKLFDQMPKTGFEVRQTEKFRAATASAEYSQGTPDGKRPGVFYTPILDPKKYNTFGMEDLFLHEAIPGHHFQIMLTSENESLPTFRRFLWYSAYGEGWALYTESLGKELGLYTDPYQYFAALSAEMHRAIRLVVDVGLHTKGWSREQAIQFSLEHEGESETSITAEIERYMAIPGQALSYKIGQLKIRELRNKAESELGDSFDIREFHNQILNDGCVPLSVLEGKINKWIESKKKIS